MPAGGCKEGQGRDHQNGPADAVDAEGADPCGTAEGRSGVEGEHGRGAETSAGPCGGNCQGVEGAVTQQVEQQRKLDDGRYNRSPDGHDNQPWEACAAAGQEAARDEAGDQNEQHHDDGGINSDGGCHDEAGEQDVGAHVADAGSGARVAAAVAVGNDTLGLG